LPPIPEHRIPFGWKCIEKRRNLI